MTNTEPNPIELVRERLDGGRLWQKGSIRSGENVCIVGAIRELPLDAAEVSEGVIADVVVAQYRDRVATEALMDTRFTSPVPSFNDHPDTTWADVDRVLDKASVAWDEQVR